jgi:hypothetical protein
MGGRVTILGNGNKGVAICSPVEKFAVMIPFALKGVKVRGLTGRITLLLMAALNDGIPILT